MKSALTYLLGVTLFLTVCTETFLLSEKYNEIRLLKTKDAQLLVGITKVYDIDNHVFEQNLEFATEINACHLFIAARGLTYIYRNQHSPDDTAINGKSKV